MYLKKKETMIQMDEWQSKNTNVLKIKRQHEHMWRGSSIFRSISLWRKDALNDLNNSQIYAIKHIIEKNEEINHVNLLFLILFLRTASKKEKRKNHI